MGLRWLQTVVLLFASNTFMTTAWYYHLKKESWSLFKAIMISWLIAFFEYCLQVPANRYGHVSNGGPFTAPQLKIVQEGISLCVFAGFSFLVLKERLRWTDFLALTLIFAGVIIGVAGKPALEDDPMMKRKLSEVAMGSHVALAGDSYAPMSTQDEEELGLLQLLPSEMNLTTFYH